jgi:hypothetical protein
MALGGGVTTARTRSTLSPSQSSTTPRFSVRWYLLHPHRSLHRRHRLGGGGEHPGLVEEREFDEEDLDAEHDDAPLRLRVVDDIIDDAAPPALARRVLDAELNFTSADELASFHEAEQVESWRQAMSEEMKAIEDNETWELTVLPAGHRAIGLKWVYKVKRNEAGNIV